MGEAGHTSEVLTILWREGEAEATPLIAEPHPSRTKSTEIQILDLWHDRGVKRNIIPSYRPVLAGLPEALPGRASLAEA